jgi:hypothetical protein
MKKTALICGVAAAAAVAAIGIKTLGPREHPKMERDAGKVALAAEPAVPVGETPAATSEVAVSAPDLAPAPEWETRAVSLTEKPKSTAKPQKGAAQGAKPARAKPPLQDPDARVALALVGDDPEAEAYWVAAINDPALPANERKDLIEDLNEDGLSDPKHPGPEDLPLIVSRIKLIEELAPYAMDPVNEDAFAEAYKDLLNMLDGVPVR